MITGRKSRKVAARLALAASVLAPAGMVLGSTAPAVAATGGIALDAPIVGVQVVVGDTRPNLVTVKVGTGGGTSGTPGRASITVTY